MAAIVGLVITGSNWVFKYDDGTELTVIPKFSSRNKVQSFTHPNGAWLPSDILKSLLIYCLENCESQIEIESINKTIKQIESHKTKGLDKGSTYTP